MNRALAPELRAAGFRGKATPNQSLSSLTTWRIGGPAELLAVPVDREDLCLAIGWAAEQGLPWRVLGNGSNLLVRDEGVEGLVMHLRKTLDDVTVEGDRLHAGSGAMFPVVARRAAGAGLSGIEFGAGIPGTIGGAVIMNAGWHEFEIGNRIEEVELLDRPGHVARRSGTGCGFGYRASGFRGRPVVILSATLRLERGRPEEIRARLEGYADSRKQNQPTELPSCGSVFLKPPGDFAGRLIEAAGLKGLRVGGVEVSRKHANFFVNAGQGRASDALELVERVEEEVQRAFGVRLEREFELW